MKTIPADKLIANLCSVEFDRVGFLPPIADSFDPTTQKIAVLASNEFEGITKNGGIGTYYATLAGKLAEEGWCVILLLCRRDASPEALGETHGGTSHPPSLSYVFSTDDIDRLLDLQPLHQAILDRSRRGNNPWFDLDSWRCLFFVSAIAATFTDAVVYVEFPAIWGFACRTIQARRSGVLPSYCFVGVTDHGGFEWLRETNCRYRTDRPHWFGSAYHVEQYSYDNANLTCFPSHFLKAKVEGYGWRVDRAVHLPYFIPLVQPLQNSHRNTTDYQGAIDNRGEGQATDGQPRDSGKIPIVFFGRLEERKGLPTFLAALQILHETDPTWHERVSIFLFGKIVSLESTDLHGLDSQAYIDRTLGDAIDYRIDPDLSSQEAIDAITRLNAPVVCLCSPQENFPNTALEMGQLPVSLVVSDTGGFRETLDLVTRTEGTRWFVPGDCYSLAQTLRAAVTAYPETPIVPDRAALERINRQLLDRRLELMTDTFLEIAPKEMPNPCITVGIPVFADGDKLAECLESLAGQTYTDLEAIVLYDPYTDEATQEAIAQTQAQFPDYQFVSFAFGQSWGSAYNQLVSRATGEYFLPLTPDRLLLPQAIETFVRATAIDDGAIVTSPDMTLDEDDLEVVTFIDASLLKLLEFNQTRDLCALFSLEWLRSFPYCEERGLRGLNWHLLAAAIATGAEIAYYPYPLSFWDRYSAQKIPPEAFPKERYYLRGSLSHIESARWSRRQLHLLLTCVEQLWQAQTTTPATSGWADAPTAQAQAWMRTAIQTQKELDALQAELEETRKQLEGLKTRH